MFATAKDVFDMHYESDKKDRERYALEIASVIKFFEDHKSHVVKETGACTFVPYWAPTIIKGMEDMVVVDPGVRFIKISYDKARLIIVYQAIASTSEKLKIIEHRMMTSIDTRLMIRLKDYLNKKSR
jgi:hypothetical protein